MSESQDRSRCAVRTQQQPGLYFSRLRAMTSRWIWLVPS
jgi:hypothetical protein